MLAPYSVFLKQLQRRVSTRRQQQLWLDDRSYIIRELFWFSPPPFFSLSLPPSLLPSVLEPPLASVTVWWSKVLFCSRSSLFCFFNPYARLSASLSVNLSSSSSQLSLSLSLLTLCFSLRQFVTLLSFRWGASCSKTEPKKERNSNMNESTVLFLKTVTWHVTGPIKYSLFDWYLADLNDPIIQSVCTSAASFLSHSVLCCRSHTLHDISQQRQTYTPTDTQERFLQLVWGREMMAAVVLLKSILNAFGPQPDSLTWNKCVSADCGFAVSLKDT